MSNPLTCIYKLLGWFPVVLINAIAVWSYFAYVVILCVDNVQDPLEKVVMLVLYHPFFLIFMISYWQAIMSSPGYMPKQFQLSLQDTEAYENSENPQEVLKEMAKKLPVCTYTKTKAIRFCEICYGIKPDRCHHCSMCSKCVLKMDHHCPWVNNCVGWGNYKYFLLFLFYSILYTMYVAFSSLKYFIKYWTGGHMKVSSNLHILFLFFVSIMFSISLWSLFGFHIYLTLSNKSTLESFRAPIFENGPDKNGFNLGRSNNFRQVFGNKKWKWFLPIFSTLGNGYSFRTAHYQNRNIESMGLLHGNMDDADHASERDTLLTYEEPAAIYTGSTFVDGDEININGYLGRRTSASDEDEEVAFDLSSLKSRTNQFSADVNMSRSRDNINEES